MICPFLSGNVHMECLKENCELWCRDSVTQFAGCGLIDIESRRFAGGRGR